ncbi:MAG: transglycosylase domain-containing protein [Bdellovibrionota bacterium]
MQKNTRKENTASFNKTSIISIIILIILAIIAYLFYSLNQYVRQTFEEKSKANTKILTDIIRIKLDARLNKEIILNFLQKLNYVNVKQASLKEGEYFIETVAHKNGILNDNPYNIYIYRRSIKSSKYNFPKTLYKLDFKNNIITCYKDTPCKEFILEPLALASNKNLKDKLKYNKLSEFNKTLIDTLILIEDKRFYKHFGLDIKSIIRALYVNTINWKTKQGASTLTQQLVKNMFLSKDRKLLRKIKEAFLSIYIECLYSKNEILEKYLNSVYLGQDGNAAIKGFYEASKFYFNKNINELDISQIALLVGMIKAPSAYSPILNYKSSIKRRNVVLRKLLDEKYIDTKTFLVASRQDIKLNIRREKETIDNYFYDALISNVPNKHFKNSSYITTGLNPLFQLCAKEAINDGLENIKAKSKQTKSNLNDIQASLVSIDSKTGLIVSYIGGADYNKSEFDRVRQGKRQIGSLIKPFIYLTALDPNLNDYKQATPLSILEDRPLVLLDANKRKWRPTNYDKRYRGYTTLREALENSLNIPTINLSLKVGLKNVASVLKKVNIKNVNDKNLALSLGAIDLSLLEITSSYTTFSNDGHFISPRFYSEIYDNKNNIINRSNIDEKNVASLEATFILNKILQGVLKTGTGRSSRRFEISPNFAGKTGTSDSQRDNWFIGYNPRHVTGVWVGRDNNKKMPFTGAMTALPIWASYINCVSNYIEDEPFKKPKNVEEVLINKLTLDECKLDECKLDECKKEEANKENKTKEDIILEKEKDIFETPKIKNKTNENCYKEYFIKDTRTKSIKEETINIKKISKKRRFFDIMGN